MMLLLLLGNGAAVKCDFGVKGKESAILIYRYGRTSIYRITYLHPERIVVTLAVRLHSSLKMFLAMSQRKTSLCHYSAKVKKTLSSAH